MINPVLFEFGPIVIRWYSLAYIVGVIFGCKYIQFLDNKLGNNILNKVLCDKMLVPIILGIIIGGRLGYVVFYNFDYYMNNPIAIVKTWQGGMSFHGGMLGLTLAIFIFSLKEKVSFLKLMDLICSAAPVGIFLGRIANFINGELFGRPSTLPWALKFLPYETITRHPTQLYEAFTEGILTFIIVNFTFIKLKFYKIPAKVSGVFLICYSVFRIIIENFREPDISLGFFFSFITMGQILSFPMLLLGIFLYNNKMQSNKIVA